MNNKWLDVFVPKSTFGWILRRLFVTMVLIAFTPVAYAQVDANPPVLKPLGEVAEARSSTTIKGSELRHRIDFLSQSSSTLADVRVEVRYLSGPDGAEEVSPQINNQTGTVTLTPIAPQSVVPIVITAKKMWLPGDYIFTLEVQVNAGIRQTYELLVKRDAPDLKIGNTDNALIDMKTENKEFQGQLLINSTNEVDADDVVVEVLGLSGPNGISTSATVGDEGTQEIITKVTGRSSHQVRLSATLSESGDYDGTVRLIYPGGVRNYPLRITRNFVPVSITTSQSKPGHGTKNFCKPTDIEFQVSVQETDGRSVRISGVYLKDLENNEVAGRYDHTEFLLGDTAIGSDQLTHVDLAPADGDDIKVKVLDVKDPGEYSGKLVFTAVDRKPVEMAVSFFVRRSGFTAAFIIFLGISVSLLLRCWGDVWQPRIKQAHEVVNVLASFNRLEPKLGALSKEEHDVLTRIKDQLLKFYDALRIRSADPSDDFVAMYKRKLPLFKAWVSVGRQLRQIGDRGKELWGEAEHVKQFLLNPAADENAYQTAKTLLEKLCDKIEENIREWQNDLIQQLKTLEPELADKSLHADWQKEVMERLDKAKTNINSKNWEQATTTLDEARAAAARTLATDLDRRLGDNLAGMTTDAHERVKEALRLAKTDTDGARALMAYKSALGLYLRGLATKLINGVERAIVALQKKIDGDGDATVLQPEIVKLTAHLKSLKTVPEFVDETNLGSARNICTSASIELERVNAILPDVGVIRGLQSVTTKAFLFTGTDGKHNVSKDKKTLIPAGTDIDVRSLRVHLPHFVDSDPSTAIEKLRRWGAAGDVLYNLGIILIGVLVGLYVLWADNPHWGTSLDMLYAALWGLGLHSITTSKTAYTGLSNLASSLK